MGIIFFCGVFRISRINSRFLLLRFYIVFSFGLSFGTG